MIIHDVEQNTDEWLMLRSGMPTASEASKLVTSTGNPSKSLTELARVLAGDLYAGRPLDKWEGNSFTERGHELEQEAREAYEFITGNKTELVGFITNDIETYGCSPDCFAGEDGMMEAKNLVAKNHIKVLDYYDKYEKAPPDYVPQCQMQMFTAEKNWDDLMYHHPDLQSLIIRQVPDLEFVSVLESQIKAVLEERDRLITILEAA